MRVTPLIKLLLFLVSPVLETAIPRAALPLGSSPSPSPSLIGLCITGGGAPQFRVLCCNFTCALHCAYSNAPKCFHISNQFYHSEHFCLLSRWWRRRYGWVPVRLRRPPGRSERDPLSKPVGLSAGGRGLGNGARERHRRTRPSAVVCSMCAGRVIP